MKILYLMKQCLDVFKELISFMYSEDRAGNGSNDCKIGDPVRFSVL